MIFSIDNVVVASFFASFWWYDCVYYRCFEFCIGQCSDVTETVWSNVITPGWALWWFFSSNFVVVLFEGGAQLTLICGIVFELVLWSWGYVEALLIHI